MSPITYPNMILFYLAITRLRRIIHATVVFVFDFKMLPPVKHITHLRRAILLSKRYPYKKMESDLYWSLEPEGVTTSHLGQPIPNLDI